MAIVQLEHAYPIDFAGGHNEATPDYPSNSEEAKVAAYICTWRQQCRSVFIQRRNIWDDCWKLYRGLDDWSVKDDWQSKIVLPKSWTSVKMATNTIKRLLTAAKKPWNIESANPDDIITTIRAEQLTYLTRHFLDKAYFLKEFTEGLECGFMLGVGVWKLWWGLLPRKQTRIQTVFVPMPSQSPQGPSNAILGQESLPQLGRSGEGMGGEEGQPTLLAPEPAPQKVPAPFGQPRFGYRQQDLGLYPSQLGGEYLSPSGWGIGGGGSEAPQSYLQTTVPQKKLIQEEILEGRLFLRAVDPYNFYWLPGSKLNRWVGTIEDIEIPKWELIKMADAGVFPREKIDRLQSMRIDERYKMSNLRFAETVMTQNGPNSDTAVCKLTEYYGPIVFDGKIVKEFAHVILGNDSTVLVYQDNPFLHQKPPYIAFSPLSLPFRTEGVGLIENVRFIDKALSQIANLSVDTLMFRLLPLFEVAVEAFENPEDLETGIVPGKMLRKNLGNAGIAGIRPVEFQDISGGTTQVAAMLDRAHQEGALISDIAEGLPRWKGQQTATESSLLQQQSESFMGGMAADIEKEAIEPLVTMAMDLIFQFIDTANDPRVASILGVGSDVLNGMSREEVIELIQGDYKVKSVGITGQLMKAEMLQNLVQLMNLIGQNPQAWLPYINQDALLRRILECFRPHIYEIEDIIADPAMQQAKKLEMTQQASVSHLIGLLPALLQHSQTQTQQEQDKGLALQEQTHQRDLAQMDQHIQVAQMALQHTQEMGAQNLQAQQLQRQQAPLQQQAASAQGNRQ
jgi:hypothetical protein